MKPLKKFLKNINPFNNQEDMPKIQFLIKKILAFLLIYVISIILAEAVIIGAHYIMGYNVLNGEMMDFTLMSLLKYYGYIVFLIIAVLYCIIVEKRSVKSMGFCGKPHEYLIGAGIAVVLLGCALAVMIISGSVAYSGVIKNEAYGLLLAFFGAFVIQGAMEEVLCRGFLMLSLTKKLSLRWAVFASATVFAVPHFSSLFTGNTVYEVLGIINLYLVAIIFSLLVVVRKNIWVACGMHSIWNFLIYSVLGLNLSGAQSGPTAIFSFSVQNQNIMNGGEYGIEASIVTVLVQAVAAVVLWKKYLLSKKIGGKDGIS